jgi:hypothetical protein
MPNAGYVLSVELTLEEREGITLGRRHAFVLGNALRKYHRSRPGPDFGLSSKCGLCRCDSGWCVAGPLTDELEQV